MRTSRNPQLNDRVRSAKTGTPRPADPTAPPARILGFERVVRRAATLVEEATPGSSAFEDARDVEAARNGERTAFDRLVVRYWRLVIHTTLRISGNEADAEDLAQETFIRAYRSIGEFRGESRFSTWVVRIATNQARSFLAAERRAKRGGTAGRVPLSSIDETSSQVSRRTPIESPDRILEMKELRDAYEFALSGLPIPIRALLEKRSDEGESYETIAQRSRLARGTLKSRLSRARSRLRAAMASAI
jgi:RNA polymerase sigma-70 factor (ECF subfamily)